MSVSKKHLEHLIDETYDRCHTKTGTGGVERKSLQYYEVIDIVAEFGREFIPNFDQSKFNKYLDKKENLRWWNEL